MSILGIGDATIDVFLAIRDVKTNCRLDEAARELCVPYGKKIPVDRSDLLLGGIACNVVVGLSRLGFITSLAAEIGDEELSRKIEATLEREKVDTKFLVKAAGQKTSLAIGINLNGDRTLFVGHMKRRHEFALQDAKCDWVFLAGLGSEWRAPYGKIPDLLAQTNAKLAFIPGTHQLRDKSEEVAAILPKTRALLINKDEAKTLVGYYAGKEVEEVNELLSELQKLGPTIVSITDGGNGAYAIDEQGKTYTVGVYPNNPVERTGAGDAYATGFFGAHLLGKAVPEAMKWGAVNAASVIGQVGSQGGLLGEKEIAEKVAGFTWK